MVKAPVLHGGHHLEFEMALITYWGYFDRNHVTFQIMTRTYFCQQYHIMQ